jgi:tetratricopeptide (TPR) repeat protein
VKAKYLTNDNSKVKKRINFAFSRFLLFVSVCLLASWLWRVEINTITKTLLSGFYYNDARRLQEKNNLDTALQKLEISVQLNPANADAWKLIAALSEIRDPQKYLKALYELSTLTAPDPNYAIKFLKTARVFKNYSQVAPLIWPLTYKFPNNPLINHEASLILVEMGHYSQARRLLKTASSLAPDNEEIKLAMLTLELLSTDLETAQNAASRIESMNISDASLAQTATHNLVIFYKKNNPAKAQALITKALEKTTASWDLRLDQIDLAYHNADESLPDLFAKAFEEAKTPSQIASLLTRISEYENPEAALRILSSMPENTYSKGEKILMEIPIHWTAKNYEKIIWLVDSAPRDDPDILGKIALWKLRALKITQPTQASAYLENILKTFAKTPLILLETSGTLCEWDMKEDARPLLQRIADSRGPYAFHALVQLFEIALSEEDTPTLLKITQSMLELQPDNAVLQFNFAALSLELGVDLPNAERIAASIHKKYPTEPVISHLYAQTLVANGKKKEALAVYDSLPKEKLLSSTILKPYENLLINTLSSEQQ